MTRYAPYGRYSSDMQNSKSAEDQIAECDRFAQTSGWDKTGEYADNARTGTTVAGRDGLMELMEDAAAHKFDVVVAEGLDRISRNPVDMHHFLQCMEHDGIRIYSLADGFVDELHVTFRGFQHSHFIKDLGKKTRRGLEAAVRRGLACGSRPYGYGAVRSSEFAPATLEIDEDQAPIVLRIFRDYRAGLSPLKIAHALNAEGVPNVPENHPWSPMKILGSAKRGTGILRNEKYNGYVVWGKSLKKMNPRTRLSEVHMALSSTLLKVESPHLRIVDDDLWTAVQERLAASRSIPLGKRRRATHLLTGLLFCGECKRGYIVQDGKRYGCSGHSANGICKNRRRVVRTELEEVVLRLISEQLLCPALIDEYVKEYNAELPQRTVESINRGNSLKKREAEVGEQIQRLLSVLTSGDTDGRARNLITVEMNRLSAELDQIGADSRRYLPVSGSPLSTEQIVLGLRSQVARLREMLSGSTADAAEAREVMRRLIGSIVISPFGDATDGRGGGPVSIQINGEFADLAALSHDNVGRVVLLGGGTPNQQNHATHWQIAGVVKNAPDSQTFDGKGLGNHIDIPGICSILGEAAGLTAPEIARRLMRLEQKPFNKTGVRLRAIRVRVCLRHLKSIRVVESAPVARTGSRGVRLLGWRLTGKAAPTDESLG